MSKSNDEGKNYYCPWAGHKGLASSGRAGSGKRRWVCYECGSRRTTKPLLKPPDNLVKGTVLAKDIQGSTRFIITSAQNNTPVFEPFHQALRRLAADQDAQLMAIMVRYSNPDSFHRGADAEMEWPPEIKDILLDKDINLCASLLCSGDTKVTPTRINPLGGMDMLGRQKSAIIGHNQLQMRMVPTSSNEPPKQLITTGTMSQKHYSRSTAGRKAQDNHNYSALYVVTGGPSSKKFWIYQLEANSSGGFYFLDKYYSAEGITTGHRPASLFIGDEHEFWLSDQERECLWGSGGIVPTLKPKILIRNDVYDGFAGSHHHQNDHIMQLRKQQFSYNDVEAELDATVKYLNETTPEYTESYVLDANHNTHFKIWLNWMAGPGLRRDIKNAVFYHKFMGDYMPVIQSGDLVGPFEFYLRLRVNERVHFVSENKPFLVGGIDNSQHGHRGANGARGSKAAFSKSVYKMNTGHSHQSWIDKGSWGAGTSALIRKGRAGVPHYASGLSSWTGDHILTYETTRTMIPTINGWWRHE